MGELYGLPEGWEWKKLGEIVKLQNGFAFKSKLFVDSGLPIVRIKNIKNEKVSLNDVVYFNEKDYKKSLDTYKIKQYDLLIAMSGATTGKIGIYDSEKNAYLNQRVGLFRIKDTKLRSYLFYFLSTQIEKNLAQSLGAAQPNLSTHQINDMNIPLPPLQEQKRIVAKLDSLFAKIDQAISLHQQNIDEVDAFMGSVLNEMFGELEERYGKTPITEVMKVSNKTLVPNDNEEYNYISLENMESHSGKLVDFSPTSGSEIKSNKVVFEKGMVLYGKLRPYLNKVWIANFDGVATTEILPFYPIDKSLLEMEYVKYYFLSPKYLQKVMNNCSGARMPRLTTQFIKSSEAYLPLPPLKNQQKTVQYLDQLSQKTQALKKAQQEKMQSLKDLKASLLDRAFRGEL